jgi:hypothetical protein
MDYIPRPDKDFLSWIVTLLKYLMSRTTKFKFPQEVYDRLEQEKNIFAQKLEVANESATHTPVNVREKNMARKVLEKDSRESVGSYLIKNPLLTEADLELLGLPIHKTTRTPAPVAETYPDFYVDSSIHRRLIIHFYEVGKASSKAKPAGQHGAEICWAISDTPIVKATKLTNSSFDTHTPFNLDFEEEERGRTVYFRLRWENTRGQKGPWSDIHIAIVP